MTPFTHIPPFVLSLLTQLGDAEKLATASGLRLQGALRAQLAEHDKSLTEQELDDLASGCDFTIAAVLTDQELEFLAQRFVQMYQGMVLAYSQQGFHDPRRAAQQAFKKVSLKF